MINILFLGALLLLAGCIGYPSDKKYITDYQNTTDKNVTGQDVSKNYPKDSTDKGSKREDNAGKNDNLHRNYNQTSDVSGSGYGSNNPKNKFINPPSENFQCNLVVEVNMDYNQPIEYKYSIYKYGNYYRIDIEQKLGDESNKIVLKYEPTQLANEYIISAKIEAGNHSECQTIKTKLESNQSLDRDFERQIEAMINYRVKHIECKELNVFDQRVFKRDC